MLPCGSNEWSFFLQLRNESAKGGISDPWSWGGSWGGTIHRVSPVNSVTQPQGISSQFWFKMLISNSKSLPFSRQTTFWSKAQEWISNPCGRESRVRDKRPSLSLPAQLQGNQSLLQSSLLETKENPWKKWVLTGPHTPFFQLGHPFGFGLNRFMAP